jgi:predicted nucleic acid-binding protein
MTHRPASLEVRTIAAVTRPALLNLGPEEREAIQLALDLGVSTVLMDEAEGRKIAEALHLEVRGTLGILKRGAKLGKTTSSGIEQIGANQLSSVPFCSGSIPPTQPLKGTLWSSFSVP